VTIGLPEDHVAMLGNTFLELFLQVPTSMLIFAKLGDLALQLFQSRSREAID